MLACVAGVNREKVRESSLFLPQPSLLVPRFTLAMQAIEIYDDWMQETTQRIIKLLGLLLPNLVVKKCSYQTSLRVL